MNISTEKYLNKLERETCIPTERWIPKDSGKNIKVKDGVKEWPRNLYNCRNNNSVAFKIFKTYMCLVLERVIEGDIFKFSPTARIYVSKLNKTHTREAREAGRYKFIDLSKTRGAIYRVMFSFSPTSRIRDMKIVIGRRLYSKFVRLQNSGKRYNTIVKTKYVNRG